METKNLGCVLGLWIGTGLTFLLLSTGDLLLTLAASVCFSLGVTFMTIVSAISEK